MSFVSWSGLEYLFGGFGRQVFGGMSIRSVGADRLGLVWCPISVACGPMGLGENPAEEMVGIGCGRF